MYRLPPELLALFGIVGVHLVPKLLQRVRIPAPVTALALGAFVNVFLPGLAHDTTLTLFATIGIASLFLFAGLEVDADVLGERPGLLVSGLLAHALAVGAATLFGVFGLGLDTAPAMLLALGIATPSGGFILDGLSGLGATPPERHAIRDTALVAEILSLVMFFAVTQSTSGWNLGRAILILAAFVGLVPLVLRVLVRFVVPHAPNSEFPLLVLTAIVGAYATRLIGVYYLIGAFVVGVVARRLRTEAPALASDRNLSAIELFASFFAPFYFARAGMEFEPSTLGLRGVGLGAVLLVFATPARIGLIAVARHLAAGEPMKRATRVSAAIVPTFVFSLVLGAVIADTFPSAAWVQGGLLVYAVGNAFVPTLLFRSLAHDESGPGAAAASAAPPDGSAPRAARVPTPHGTLRPAQSDVTDAIEVAFVSEIVTTGPSEPGRLLASVAPRQLAPPDDGDTSEPSAGPSGETAAQDVAAARDSVDSLDTSETPPSESRDTDPNPAA